MISLKRWLVFAGLMILTSACAVFQEPHTKAVDGNWQAPDGAALIVNWALQGRFAAHNEGDAWHGDMTWRQAREQFAIQLSGPLGQGKLEIEGSAFHAELRLSSDEIYIANSAEDLLLQYAGLHFPVAGLRYWIVGRPSPQFQVDSMEQDDRGRLTRIRQEGWDIKLKRYTSVKGIDLPTKIFLEHPEFDVRLVVDEWQLPV